MATFAPGVAGLWLFLNAGFFVYATRAGKFAVWAEVLDQLDLEGDERLLDVGCGRGAVLLMAAQRLPRGRAVGVDVWSAKDQSGPYGSPLIRELPDRSFRIEPQDVHVAVLPDSPDKTPVRIVHQSHRVVERLLADRVGAFQVNANPGVGSAVVHRPERSAAVMGTDENGILV